MFDLSVIYGIGSAYQIRENGSQTKGKKMDFKLIAKSENYRLYKVDGWLELWYGNIANRSSYKLGYVSEVEGFHAAVLNVQEEIAALMVEAGA